MRRFRNDHTLSSRHRLLEVLHSVIPNLFRDLCFAPLGGRWTVDGQPSLQQRSTYFSKRPAALKRACFGIFVLLLSEDGGPLTLNVAFSSVQRVSVLKRTAVVWARSRTGTLRDDRRGVRRGRLYGMSVLLPYVILTMLLVRISDFAVFSRPDPVQKHHGMTEEARKRDHRSRQSLFSLAAFSTS